MTIVHVPKAKFRPVLNTSIKQHGDEAIVEIEMILRLPIVSAERFANEILRRIEQHQDAQNNRRIAQAAIAASKVQR